MYSIEHGQADERNVAEKIATTLPSHREDLHLLQLYIKVAEASLEGIKSMENHHHPLPKMPCQRGIQTQSLGERTKKEEAVRRVSTVVPTQPYEETYFMQSKLPLDLGKAKRLQAVAKARTNRLRALGNAVVPAIAEEIGRIIMEVEHGS